MSDQQSRRGEQAGAWNTGQHGQAPWGGDPQPAPWERGGQPGGDPTMAMPADPGGGRHDRGRDTGSHGRPPGGRGMRTLLLVLASLLVVAILAIVVLVFDRPAKSNLSSNQPGTKPTVSATSQSPSPSTTGSGPAPTPSGSPGAPTASGSPNAVGATGGGAGAQVADLSALNPVQANNIDGPNPGPVQIGATVYQNSVGFTCSSYQSYFDYNVAGYKFLTALIGIPSSASNAAGNTMTITFFKDGSSTQLGSPVTVSLDHPQSVHLNLQGSSQLEIACSATSDTTHSAVSMDGALGNATIGPN